MANQNPPVDTKTLVKHDGCYDCGSVAEPVLTSVLTTRLHGKNQEPRKGSYALCSRCITKEDVAHIR
jgi:hypothetical protein